VIGEPKVNQVPLASLSELEFSQSSTLFIPALGEKEIDEERSKVYAQLTSDG